MVEATLQASWTAASALAAALEADKDTQAFCDELASDLRAAIAQTEMRVRGLRALAESMRRVGLPDSAVSRGPFELLPDEVVLRILLLLQARDAAAFGATCRRLLTLWGDEYHWRMRCITLPTASSTQRRPEVQRRWLARFREAHAVQKRWLQGHVQSTRLLPSRSPNAEVYALAQYGAGAVLVAGGSDRRVRVWRHQERVGTLSGHRGSVVGLSVQQHGQKITSASDDCTVRLWDTQSSRCLVTLRSFSWVGGFDYADEQDGNVLVVGAGNGNVYLWDLRAGQEPQHAMRDPQRELTGGILALKVRGPTVYAGYNAPNAGLSYHDLRGPRGCLVSTTLPTTGIFCMDVDDHLVVTGSRQPNPVVQFWSPTSGKCLHTASGHSHTVQAVRMDAQKLVSTSADGTIRIWDRRDRVLRASLLEMAAGDCAAMDFQGSLLFTGHQNGMLKLWSFSPDLPLDESPNESPPPEEPVVIESRTHEDDPLSAFQFLWM